MNILFITGNYYDYCDANGYCVNELINLLKIDNNIFIICYGDKNECINVANNIIIYRVKKKKNNIGNHNFLNKLVKVLLHFSSYPVFEKRIGNKMAALSKKIIKEKFIDVLISVINPLETIYPILKNKKNDNVKKIIYELDSISDQPVKKTGLYKLLLRKRLNFEKKSYKKSDYIIQMECHRKHYSKSHYDQFRQKMIYSDFPVYIPKDIKYEFDNNRKKSILYAGSFLKGIREPEHMINYFLNSKIFEKISLFLYCQGEYDEYFKSVLPLCKNSLFLMGYVSTEELEKSYINSDVLLSVGNLAENMIPSKIYIYMSYKKPIIHFSYFDDDPVLTILKNYPYAYIVRKSDNIEKTTKELNYFLTHLSEICKIDFDDNFLKYNKPCYTVNIIKELANE